MQRSISNESDGKAGDTNDQSVAPGFVFKVILTGDSGVGKTTILKRLLWGKFFPNYEITVGLEFSSYPVQIDPETQIKLQIWDTAGQESFRSIIKSFYRNSAAVFMVYNVCDRKSFEHLDSWVDEAKQSVDCDAIFVLIGNQTDRDAEREVSYTDAENFMRAKDMSFFFETSALDGQNIQMAFDEAAKMIYYKYLALRYGENVKDGVFGGQAQKVVITKKTSVEDCGEKGCRC